MRIYEFDVPTEAHAVITNIHKQLTTFSKLLFSIDKDIADGVINYRNEMLYYRKVEKQIKLIIAVFGEEYINEQTTPRPNRYRNIDKHLKTTMDFADEILTKLKTK